MPVAVREVNGSPRATRALPGVRDADRLEHEERREEGEEGEEVDRSLVRQAERGVAIVQSRTVEAEQRGQRAADAADHTVADADRRT